MRTMRVGFDTDLFRDSGDVRRRTSFEGAYLFGEAGTRKERRYGGGAAGYSGTAGRELTRVFLTLQEGREAESAESATSCPGGANVVHRASEVDVVRIH